jgi:hypothetical protein
MEICGLRQARDVDYLTDYDMEEVNLSFELGTIDEHSSQLKYHSISIKDMLYNPNNYFYFDGFKFLSIQRIKEMKECRNEKKDRRDIKLCDLYLRKKVYIPKAYRYRTLEKIRKVQISHNRYGQGTNDYYKYRKAVVKEWFYRLYRRVMLNK